MRPVFRALPNANVPKAELLNENIVKMIVDRQQPFLSLPPSLARLQWDVV